jgi:uncharacterized membrane protein YedE/YeeE
MRRLGLGLGFAFGFLITSAGFADASFIHRMLLLQNWYPYLMIGSAIGTALPLLWLLERRRWKTPLNGELKVARSTPKPKHVYGGLLFGTGWALTCTCPVPAIGMSMSGGLLGPVVMAGLFTGIALREAQVRQASGQGQAEHERAALAGAGLRQP